jgi:hypothetical protein
MPDQTRRKITHSDLPFMLLLYCVLAALFSLLAPLAADSDLANQSDLQVIARSRLEAKGWLNELEIEINENFRDCLFC